MAWQAQLSNADQSRSSCVIRIPTGTGTRRMGHRAGHIQRRTPKRFGARTNLADAWNDDADHSDDHHEEDNETHFVEEQQVHDFEDFSPRVQRRLKPPMWSIS